MGYIRNNSLFIYKNDKRWWLIAKWKYFSSKPKKSLVELETEVNQLKKAENNIKKYRELQDEKAKIKAEIKREGFKERHRKALSIISKAENVVKNIHKTVTSPKAKRFVKKVKKTKIKW